MAKFTDAEYDGLDTFIKAVLRRVEARKSSADEAHSHILHVLTACDQGDDQEVTPYMRTLMEEWTKDNV